MSAEPLRPNDYAQWTERAREGDGTAASWLLTHAWAALQHGDSIDPDLGQWIAECLGRVLFDHPSLFPKFTGQNRPGPKARTDRDWAMAIDVAERRAAGMTRDDAIASTAEEWRPDDGDSLRKTVERAYDAQRAFAEHDLALDTRWPQHARVFAAARRERREKAREKYRRGA